MKSGGGFESSCCGATECAVDGVYSEGCRFACLFDSMLRPELPGANLMVPRCGLDDGMRVGVARGSSVRRAIESR